MLAVVSFFNGEIVTVLSKKMLPLRREKIKKEGRSFLPSQGNINLLIIGS